MAIVKRVLVTAGVAVAALCAVLVIGVIVSGVMGEAVNYHNEDYGVARSGGQLLLYQCRGDGIGKVNVQIGDAVDAPVAWSTNRLVNAAPATRVALLGPTPGYRSSGSAARAMRSGTLTLDGLEDGRGRPVGSTVLTFQPAQVREGTVEPGQGPTQRLDLWLAKHPSC